ncbi:MAG: DUF721 domain-containing protein [Geminicoccaceae bacterium]
MAAEQDTRQGRSGQAGLQVARLLAGILDPAARRRGFAEASLLADWATIVGPSLARRCQPLRLDHAPGRRAGGTLLVRVGGAAALELQHATPQILERINAYFGRRVVRQLRLLQMPLPVVAAPARPAMRPLDAAEEAALAHDVHSIASDPLRTALLALGRTVTGSRRRRQPL